MIYNLISFTKYSHVRNNRWESFPNGLFPWIWTLLERVHCTSIFWVGLPALEYCRRESIAHRFSEWFPLIWRVPERAHCTWILLVRPLANEYCRRGSLTYGFSESDPLNMNCPGEGSLHMDSLSGTKCLLRTPGGVPCTWTVWVGPLH